MLLLTGFAVLVPLFRQEGASESFRGGRKAEVP